MVGARMNDDRELGCRDRDLRAPTRPTSGALAAVGTNTVASPFSSVKSPVA